MTYLEIYTSCTNLFLDNWIETEIDHEGALLKVNDLDEFVRFQVFNDNSENFSHASTPNKLLTGHIAIEIYVRRGNGPGRLISLVDQCVAIFSNVKLSNGLKFQSPQIIDRASDISGETVTDPNWISKNVLTRFKAPLS